MHTTKQRRLGTYKSILSRGMAVTCLSAMALAPLAQAQSYTVQQASKTGVEYTAFNGVIRAIDPSQEGVLQRGSDFRYVKRSGGFALTYAPTGKELYQTDDGVHNFISNAAGQNIAYVTMHNNSRAYSLTVDYNRDGVVDFYERGDVDTGTLTTMVLNNPEMERIFEAHQSGLNMFCEFPASAGNSLLDSALGQAVPKGVTVPGCPKTGGSIRSNAGLAGSSGDLVADQCRSHLASQNDRGTPSILSSDPVETIDTVMDGAAAIATLAGGVAALTGATATATAAAFSAPAVIVVGVVAGTAAAAWSLGRAVTNLLGGSPLPDSQADGVALFCAEYLDTSAKDRVRTWRENAQRAQSQARCLDPTVNPGSVASGPSSPGALSNPVDDRFCQSSDGIPTISDVVNSSMESCPSNVEPDKDGNCISSNRTPGKVDVNLGAALIKVTYDTLGIVNPIDPVPFNIQVDKKTAVEIKPDIELKFPGKKD